MRTIVSVCWSEIERVSSGGADANISRAPRWPAEVSAKYVTNDAMPACATVPTHERSCAGSSLNHGYSESRVFSAIVARRPVPARRRRRVSARISGVTIHSG
ncbi:hypothetical protein GCM10025873_05210 [Demequina sediminis]|nr:hypothetical protein GCM10025873_05210 [Demequina sediminis]